MTRYLLLVVLVHLACHNAPPNGAESSTEVVTFVRDSVNPFLLSQQPAIANAALQRKFPAIENPKHPAHFYWIIIKVPQHIIERRLDSAKYYAVIAGNYAREKQINQNDSNMLNAQWAHIYYLEKKMDSAIYFALKAYYNAKLYDTPSIPRINYRLAEIYSSLGDMEARRKYLFEGYQLTRIAPYLRPSYALAIAKYYDDINQTDSAIDFLRKTETDTVLLKSKEFTALRMENTGVLLLRLQQPAQALKQFLRAMPISRELGIYDAQSLFNIAKAYGGLQAYSRSNVFLDSALQAARIERNLELIGKIWELKAENSAFAKNHAVAYSALDSANRYIKIAQDSSMAKYARELATQYATREKEEKIRYLGVVNQVNKTKSAQQQLIIFALAVSLLSTISFGWLVYHRRKIKIKAHESALRQQLLRSQLNSHFLFNSLSIGQALLRSGETEKSATYLQTFSTLLSTVLKNSRQPYVELQSEIMALENYLKLQQLNFPGLFEYTVRVESEENIEDIMLPPMLLQPFVENSIVHGFSGIDYKGSLYVEIKRKLNSLDILIEDNGRGFIPGSPERKSNLMATHIISELLNIIKKQKRQSAYLNIVDKHAEGTGQGVKVTLQWPI